ncbi:MAG: hypothetical protein KME15_16185 [Drouetiella hepatica Uher 2000/2452]|jgi:hypothetical protein|uniref:Uncharacterized protein n=1 Tax=Drouetiella hepatica Uher 2000/2452 TaxID=904376 RepID=A0A951UN87_9CYAN|nr:hypothetical protein [Drouetiella hepatica Uher 2000/2452]
MKPSTPIPLTESDHWQAPWQNLAQSRFWFLMLTVMGSASSVTYAHPPLVAFAAIAGATLRPKLALLSAMTVWLASQLYGYVLRDYPYTSESLIWGLVMGFGTLFVALIATLRPSFSRQGLSGHIAWVAIALGTGFLLFEGLVMFCGFLLTGTHVFTLTTLGLLLFKETVWTIALATLHGFLIWRKTGALAISR